MDKRIKHRNPEREAELRRELFEGVMNHRLSIAEAVRQMQKVNTNAAGVSLNALVERAIRHEIHAG